MMTHRMRAAGLVAIFGLVLALAPSETFAGSASVSVGCAPAFHGGFRPGFARPLPGVPRAGVIGLGSATAHRSWARQYRGVYGFGAPYALYAAPGYVAPYGQNVVANGEPAPARPAAARVIVVRPPRCETQTLTVPSEAGGERQVTVRRCWPGLQLNASEIGN